MSSLVGRESELETIATFLGSERPRALAIVGEPGIGKTRLWQAAVEHAQCAGRASADREADRVGSPARLRGVDGSARRASRGILRATARAAAGGPRRRPLTRRLRTASRASRRRRWIPHAPARACSGIRGRMRDRRPAVARRFVGGGGRVRAAPARRRAGARPLLGARRGAHTAPIPALERELQVEYLELGPLSVAALHRVLTQELGRTFPRRTLVRIAQAAGGIRSTRSRSRASSTAAASSDISSRRSCSAGPRRARPGTRPGASGGGTRRTATCSGPGAARHRDDRPGRARACGGGGTRARRGGRADRVRPPALRVGRVLRRSGGPAPRGASRRRRPCARPGGASAASRARGARPGRRGRAGTSGGRPPRAHARLPGFRRRVDRARAAAAPGRTLRTAGAPARARRATPSRQRLRCCTDAARGVAHDAAARRSARTGAPDAGRDRLLARGRVRGDGARGGGARGRPRSHSQGPLPRCRRALRRHRRPPEGGSLGAGRACTARGVPTPIPASSRRR